MGNSSDDKVRAALTDLVRLKDMKEWIESGTAPGEIRAQYEAEKEPAWEAARLALERGEPRQYKHKWVPYPMGEYCAHCQVLRNLDGSGDDGFCGGAVYASLESSTRSHALRSEPSAEAVKIAEGLERSHVPADNPARIMAKEIIRLANSATLSTEDAACKVAADLLRNEIVRLDKPKAMFPQEAEKIGRRQAAFQEAVRYLDPSESRVNRGGEEVQPVQRQTPPDAQP